MGSGSYGGGGGGGGGGIYRTGPGIVIENVVIHDPENPIETIFTRLPKEYIEKQFCNSLLRYVYEQLFRLSVEVFQNRSWDGVQRHYGVDGAAGCLMRWSGAVASQFHKVERNRKAQEVARSCLEDFLMLALDNDYDLFIYGTSKEILRKLNQKIFNSTSAYFLGLLIWRIVEREIERASDATEIRLRELSQEKADQIIRGFESRFYAKGQTTYRDLFRVICLHLTWFMEQLRK